MNPDDSAFDDIALRAFLRFGSAIGVLEEPELYPNLLDVVFELIPARRTAIMFASDDGDKFVSGIYRERGREVDADFVPSGKATRGVLATGTPSMSNDDSPPALCALMRTRTRKLGVIYAEIPLVETGFAPKHLNYMVGIAGLASAALRQAKSFEGGRTEGQLPAAFAQSGFAAGMNAHGLLGDSPAMLRLHDQVRRAGRNNRYVLILGEPGTGKELVARGIHQGSPRSDKVFLPINCASIPADTMESQMFGHEKGSFTGAISRRIGWVEIARRGTLFLDEVGDMPLVLQPKLLRFLQEQEFMRLGGNEVLRSDVRIVAATHRDLQSMVKAGLFREDLLNRLEVFTINVPPLRDRPGDILPLAWHFIKKNADLRQVPVTQMDPEVQRLFREAPWPGNVRRLENTIVHALGNGDPESGAIQVNDLPEWLRPAVEQTAEEEITPERFFRALDQAQQNRTKAARILGMSRAQFYRLMKKFGGK